MKRLYIGGVDVTNDVTGLKTFDIDIAVDETGTVQKTLSGDIKIKNAVYQSLVKTYWQSCKNFNKTIPASFYTDICGGIRIGLVVTVQGMDYYPNQEYIQLPLKTIDDSEKCQKRLSTELVYENGFLESETIPKIDFSTQPNSNALIIILLKAALTGVIAPLLIWAFAITNAIELICKTINLIPGIDIDCPEAEDINPFGKLYDYIDEFISGAGKWAPAPLIREMIEFQAAQCGLKFESSILNDPSSSRYNLSWFTLGAGKFGTYRDKSEIKAREIFLENADLFATTDLLERLKVPFEAEYKIIGDTLYFERFDFFERFANFQIYDATDDCDACYSYDLGDLCAAGEYSFTQDPIDQEGNKVLASLYRENYSFTDNLDNTSQSGKCLRISDFGPARFMYDIESFNRNGWLDFEHAIDDFRAGKKQFDLFAFAFGNSGVKRENDLIVSTGQTSKGKLLVLEDNFDRNSSRVIRKPFKDGYWYYNHPMYYAPKVLGELNSSGLFEDYGFMADPSQKKDIILLRDLTTNCDCGAIKNILERFHQCYIKTPMGKGIPGAYKIRFKETSIELVMSNIKVWCQN